MKLMRLNTVLKKKNLLVGDSDYMIKYIADPELSNFVYVTKLFTEVRLESYASLQLSARDSLSGMQDEEFLSDFSWY